MGVDLETARKELSSKKTFVGTCKALASEADALCADADRREVFADVVKRAFVVAQTRFTGMRFWSAGLELFLAFEFALPEELAAVRKEASVWVTTAMEQVDEDARAAAAIQRQRHAFEEEKRHQRGRFGDSVTPATYEELAHAAGFIVVEEENDRPAASRDARDDLRLITVTADDQQQCVVCLEDLPIGAKAKQMPCGHLFHDDCLLTWLAKNHSCPLCRDDTLPTEKRHFDASAARRGERGVGHRDVRLTACTVYSVLHKTIYIMLLPYLQSIQIKCNLRREMVY